MMPFQRNERRKFDVGDLFELSDFSRVKYVWPVFQILKMVEWDFVTSCIMVPGLAFSVVFILGIISKLSLLECNSKAGFSRVKALICHTPLFIHDFFSTDFQKLPTQKLLIPNRIKSQLSQILPSFRSHVGLGPSCFIKIFFQNADYLKISFL